MNTVDLNSFKQELTDNFIPFIEKLIKKEQMYLDFLIKNNVIDFIESSKRWLDYYNFRLTEYQNYVKNA